MSTDQWIFPFNAGSDFEFDNVINENDNHSFPLNIINSLSFNRYNFNDADVQNDYIINEPVCDYYHCDTLLPQQLPKNSLKLLSYNIFSIPLHFDSFCDQCLVQTDVDFDFIAFCETRLNDAISSLYNMPNYTPYF